MTFGLINLDPCILKYTKFDEDWPKITPPFGSLNLIGPIWASGGHIVQSNSFILLEQLETSPPNVPKLVPLVHSG